METNAQNTLVLIFQHVGIYYSLLDYYAHESKVATSFRISEYEAVLDNYIKTQVTKDTEKQRVASSLSIANLDACSLLSFVNEQRGIFAIQPGLLQTIQSLESKRIRELGQPDLDVITAKFKPLYAFFNAPACDLSVSTQELEEHLASLMDVMQDTLAKVAHNVRALDGSSKRLSEILESHDFNQLVATEQVRSAIDEIIHISKRNIQPTLTFLNEKAMAPDSSAMYMIRQMRGQLESTVFIVQHRNISSIEMKLLSYAEVIREIRQRLYRYVDMDKTQRALYNQIEEKFNQLHEEAVMKMDAKLKGKQIQPTSPLLTEARALWGMHNWSRSNLVAPLLQMPSQDIYLALNEHIRTKLNQAEALGDQKRKPSTKTESAAVTLQKRKRVKHIKALMQELPLLENKADVYLGIHNLLSEKFSDYRLSDIYDALPFIPSNWTIRKTLVKNEIEFNHQRLTYMTKRLEETEND